MENVFCDTEHSAKIRRLEFDNQRWLLAHSALSQAESSEWPLLLKGFIQCSTNALDLGWLAARNYPTVTLKVDARAALENFCNPKRTAKILADKKLVGHAC